MNKDRIISNNISMKKILILFLFLTIGLNIICLNQSEQIIGKNELKKVVNNNIKQKEITYMNKKITYPVINDIIDTYIENKIKQIISNNKGLTSYKYEYYIDNNIISYIFNFEINNKIEIKCFNIDFITNSLCLIDLKDYKALFAQSMKTTIVNKNYDLNYIEYSIQNNKIKFYLSNNITNIIPIIIETNLIDNIIKEKLVKEETKKIALTFDDGPSSKTKQLINLLHDLDIKATFFVLGKMVNIYQEELIYIYNFGHEIGNHTYNHYDLSKKTIYEIKKEINETKKLIHEVIYVYPKIIRLPYGAFNKKIINDLDEVLIQWDCDSLDWKNKNYWYNISKNIQNGSILLFHDLASLDLYSLKYVLNKLLKSGYEFVVISDLLELGYNYESKLFFNKKEIIY